MIEATVFMKVRHKEKVYCLKTKNPRQFVFPPTAGTHVSIEAGIGNCLVTNLNQRAIDRTQPNQPNHSVTVDVDCMRDLEIGFIRNLIESKRWQIVVSGCLVVDENDNCDELKTRELQEELARKKDVIPCY